MALAENRKARMNYEPVEEFEAGLELLGFEVKALRAGEGKLDGSHALVRGGQAYLVGASIPAYQPQNAPKDYDPSRTRRLLLTKPEIAKLSAYESQKGLTIVPTRVYNKGRVLKVQLMVGRGRKKFDKRAALKQRDEEREIRRTLKKE